MNCKEALLLIHEWLDGDLDGGKRLEALRLHLADCVHCTKRFRELEQTEAIIRMLHEPKAPPQLAETILSALPSERTKAGWMRWIRKHPGITAAAAFLIIMASSFFSLWSHSTQLAVRGDDLDGIVLDEGRVIIPSGKTMDGNLIVENGTVQVDGDVKGNLVVIDGNVALASTAHISGRISKVNRALDYVWFKINEWFDALVPQPQT